MKLMSCITEKRNKFLDEAVELRDKGCPIYIYGGGGGAQKAAMRLDQVGVNIDGFLVDKKYLTDSSNAIAIEDFMASADQKIGVIGAFTGYSENMLLPYQNKITKIITRDCYGGLLTSEDDGFFTYQWVMGNEELLETTYSMLEDDLSRKTLAAYINQKISADFKYLKQVKRLNQYFEDDLVQMTDHERFIDCGGYDGDTAAEFLNALKRRGVSSYEEIISFEPDTTNFVKMLSRKIPGHSCVCMGVGEIPGVVRFDGGSGTTGRVLSSGNSRIKLESIDHYLAGTSATMIKMDIEGLELSALKGAKETITTYHPKLAICVYHKREDLWEIPLYIKQLWPEYKFYMRAYADIACELVLYAL